MNVEAIGQTLRSARKKLGVTQADAAELAGVSERTVRDIEKGKDSPSIAAYIALADVVGLRIELSDVVNDGR